MRKIKDFDAYIRGICGSKFNYYFQPPGSIKMKYPAIVYTRTGIPTSYADDIGYRQYTEYKVVVITIEPDVDIVETLSSLPLSRFVSHYASDNLNHNVFTIYY